MKYLSFAIIAVTICYFFAIKLMGKVAIKSRTYLLFLFRPAFYLTAIILALITLINGALLVGALYYGESLLLHMVHVKIILLIAAGAMIGFYILNKSIWMSLKMQPTKVDGVLLDSNSYLSTLVNSVNSIINAGVVDNIILGNQFTFFVTENPILISDKKLKGKTIYLSKPVAEFLSENEIKAIVAHELSHFVGEDTKYGQKFGNIYRGMVYSINSIADNSGGAMAFALIPTQVMLSHLYSSFSIAENKHNRERELIADKKTQDVVESRDFCSALLKTVALTKMWEKAYIEGQEIENDKYDPYQTTFEYFNKMDKTIENEEIDQVVNQEVFHPFDSHPKTIERIESLGEKLEDIKRSIKFEKNIIIT
jgi:Zn-dependent protease with chaperone function